MAYPLHSRPNYRHECECELHELLHDSPHKASSQVGLFPPPTYAPSNRRSG